ncbi:hemagglutinin repeat-containing protein [Psychrobacter sp.]|uniref:two-partner secretion domain-containing protein n=1 Tax=Psychrobacter sp. TaxID=56811 RepID=UPI0025F7B27C|nr:hemagglutinin repeat-containing protein [Psychrobacter sp.]
MKSMKLSVAGRISAFMAIASLSSTAMADIRALGNVNVQKQSNGVEVVNINAPNAQGLSHNQYDQFNVSKSGAVINNATQSGQSVLAGNLGANANLKNQAATVILNEVVSRKPSLLLGKQEVFGMAADYVLANPNGISCEGCGYLNAPRVSLAVAKPEITNGKLTGYNTKNDRGLRIYGGVQFDDTKVVDLIAPQIYADASIKNANNVNVVMGRNKVGINPDGSLSATSIATKSDSVLDGNLLGSMQAGRITLHSTDDRATMDVKGVEFNTKDFNARAGNLNMHGNIKNFEQQYSQKDSPLITSTTLQIGQHYLPTRISADNVDIQTTKNLSLNGTQIVANKVNLQGDNIGLNGEKTINTIYRSTNTQKGGLKEETLFHTDKVTALYGSSIRSNNINIDAKTGSITGNSSQIVAPLVRLNAGNSIALTGGNANEFHDITFENRLGTIALKRVVDSESASRDYYIPTAILANKAAMTSGGNQEYAGAQIVAKDMGFKTPGTVSFSAETSKATHNIDHKVTYWGGLFGSQTDNNDTTIIKQNGADVQASNLLYIDAGKGLNLTGSRVLAVKNAYLNSPHGDFNIKGATETTTNVDLHRTGTIFDIPIDVLTTTTTDKTNHESVLESYTNLGLVTDQNINIVGSQVKAAGLLDLEAGKELNIVGVKDIHDVTTVHDTLGIVADIITKPSLYAADAKVAGTNLTNAKASEPTSKSPNVAQPITTALYAAQPDASTLKEATPSNSTLKVDASKSDESKSISLKDASVDWRLGLGITHDVDTDNTQTVSGSLVSGGTTTLKGGDVNIAGSKVTSENDLNISGNNVTTSAQDNSHTVASDYTDVFLGLKGSVDTSGVTVGLGLDVNNQKKSDQTTTPVASQLSGQNVTIKADSDIHHSGTNITAQDTVSEQATNITHDQAHATQTKSDTNVDVNIGLSASADYKGGLSAGLNIGASGSGNNNVQTQGSGTTISAGTINEQATNALNDEGTHYKATGDVNLSGKDVTLASGYDSTKNTSNTGGASINLGLGGLEGASPTGSVGVSANFQHEQAGTTTAKPATIEGANVNIHGDDTVVSQSNITTPGSLNVDAGKEVSLVQSNNTSNATGGGFDVSVNVGGLALDKPTPQPSVGVSVGANGHNGSSLEGVNNTVTAGNVNLSTSGTNGTVNVQGTNLTTDKLNIDTNTANIAGTTSTAHSGSGAVEASVKVGSGGSSLELGGNIGAGTSQSQSTGTSDVNAGELTINADTGVNISHANVTADNATINTNGNLNINAGVNTDQHTSVDLGGTLNAKKEGDVLVPKTASVSVGVNTGDSLSHTPATVSISQDANLNVGGDLNVTGSSLNTRTIRGNVNGNVNNETLQGHNNQTDVNIAIGAQGFPVDYTPENAGSQLISDIKNGTIAGVKPIADIDIHHSDATTTQTTPVGIKTDNGQLNVGGITNTIGVGALDSQSGFDFTFNPSANYDPMAYLEGFIKR